MPPPQNNSYQPLEDSGDYSPPLQPSYRASADMTSTELRSLNGNDVSAGPPSPSVREDISRDDYSYSNAPDVEDKGLVSEPQYRQYKRRYFGLAVLTLLNFAIGWGYAAPGVVSTTAIEWFDITYPMLNNLSIASSLVFLVPAPFVIWILNRHGPKYSIIVACLLTVVGNWIVYGATRAHSFAGNVVGTIIAALANPFTMAAPTRYSRMWFDDRGRTFATAIQSLAYPLGAGFGALTGPMMVKPVGPLNYAGQALIIAIVFTVVSIPAPFLPKEPPTPPSVVAASVRLGLRDSMKVLFRNPTFYLQFITFSLVAGSIDTITATTNQAIVVYGYTQSQAGIALAVLIFVGIITAMIISPILDRTKKHTLALKIISCFIAASFTALPFVPQTHSVPALMIVFGLIGASTISVEPAVLEIQATWTHPVSPEFSSVICWGGSRVVSALFTFLVGSVLPLDERKSGQPKGSLFYGQIFIAVMCWMVVPCSWLMGVWIFKKPEKSNVQGND